MKLVCDNKQCSGCGLCAFSCPKHCITMESGDSFGHLFPHIDQSLCIDCGLCRKTCPALNPFEKQRPITAYAAWSADEEDYKSSTSGAAASVLSRYVLEQGGVVYGCAMLPDIDVRHIRIENVNDVSKLKGSKYVQSNLTGIYSDLKRDVLAGRQTLFIGTPCQVAAVKRLFKNQPENLVLVDLICHGVPSLELLRQHIKKVADYTHYDRVVFREGNGIYVVVVVDGQEVYRKAFLWAKYTDWYISTFFYGYTYRDSCYQCQYACPERISDITIGDFWKLGKKISADYIPEHRNGCSVILPSTEKGRILVKKISPKMNLFERTVDEAVDGNDQLRTPTSLDWRKKGFRKLYPILGRSSYRLFTFDKFLLYQTKRIIRWILR